MANARELLAQYAIGVDLSQLVRADSMVAAVANKVGALSGALAGAGGKAATLDVDASGMQGLEGIVGRAKDALAGLFAIEGIHRLASGFEELTAEGGKLNDLSEKLGVGTDELQQFAYATSLAGVEADSAYAALGKLQRNVGNAMSGGKEQVAAFADLGIAFKDASGEARPLIDIAQDVADSVKNSGSEAEAAAKLTKVFGKAGAELIPAFKEGGQALRDMSEEFEALGGGMSKDFIKKADAVDDQLTRLRFAAKNLKIQVASELLPYAVKFTNQLVKGAKGLMAFTKDTNALRVAFIALGTGGAVFATMKIYEMAKALGFVNQAAGGAGGAIKGMFSFGVAGTAVVLGVAILAALFEDLYTLMTGGKSVLGEFLDETYGLGTSVAFVKEIKDAWGELNEALADPALEPVKEAMGDLAKGVLPAVLMHFVNLVKTASAFAQAAAASVNSIKQLAKIMGTLELDPKKIAINSLSNGFGGQNFLKQDAASQQQRTAGRIGLGETAGKLGAALSNVFNGLKGGDGAEGLIAARRNLGVEPSLSAVGEAAGAGVGKGVGDVTQTNQIKIEVKGGPANADTGDAVSSALQKGLGAFGLDNALAAVKRR